MRMLVIMIRPMLVLVAVRRAGWRQLLGRMGVPAAEMVRVIMAEPAILGHKVRYQQTLAMMPTALVDVEVPFALGGALLLGQAVPFQVRVLLQQCSHIRQRQDAIARALLPRSLPDPLYVFEQPPLLGPCESHRIARRPRNCLAKIGPRIRFRFHEPSDGRSEAR